MVRPLHLAWALLLGGCFTASFAAGLPCAVDLDCGPELRCEAGVCGGTSGQASTTAAPTTSGTGTGTSTTTTGDPQTSGPQTGTTGDACGIGRCKDFDVLFVVDNSLSMFPKTLLALDFVQTFGNTLIPELRQACSVHVGVTTTDAYPHNPEPCKERGALVQVDKGGDACEFIEGHAYATLPDLAQPLSLQCMFDVVGDGDPDERPVDAFFLVAGQLDQELTDGCNAGFYRPDAFLTALFVTDEDDDNNDAQGHSGSGIIFDQAWATTLGNLKATDDIYLVGLLGDPAEGEPACDWDPLLGDDGAGYESAPQLRKFLESWPAERRAIDTLCNRVPNAGAYEAMMNEVLAELRAACGA